MASFTVSLVLAAHHAVEPATHEPAGLIGPLPHLEPTGPVLPHTHDWWLPATAGALLAALVAAVGARAGRARRRHRAVLDVVAVRVRRLGRPGSGRRRQLSWWLGLLLLSALPYPLACAPHP
ncbi:hypothetical protein [Kitasatospora cathayae]|uniref:Uncharacterized protein n=1 Tax=Kitasatospora cathayae TaxID=3004092 RepID=A0ABY7QC17_9ACTN|nr:hypothetical protein [Kitasatospora sp. HUAS 3-15]WBP90132.1 hypothetical protein O1G21_32610 [Kitasatospora sp. HUAS 3-15]